jgi:hypothetical protein
MSARVHGRSLAFNSQGKRFRLLKSCQLTVWRIFKHQLSPLFPAFPDGSYDQIADLLRTKARKGPERENCETNQGEALHDTVETMNLLRGRVQRYICRGAWMT